MGFLANLLRGRWAVLVCLSCFYIEVSAETINAWFMEVKLLPILLKSSQKVFFIPLLKEGVELRLPFQHANHTA